jgi:hypothetical protein
MLLLANSTVHALSKQIHVINIILFLSKHTNDNRSGGGPKTVIKLLLEGSPVQTFYGICK